MTNSGALIDAIEAKIQLEATKRVVASNDYSVEYEAQKIREQLAVKIIGLLDPNLNGENKTIMDLNDRIAELETDLNNAYMAKTIGR